jgi:hypothetical protein
MILEDGGYDCETAHIGPATIAQETMSTDLKYK